MKINKKILFLVTLFIAISIGGSVLAATYSINDAYFSKGKSHNVVGNFGTEIIATTRATTIIGRPIVNVKCQKKVALIYNSGSNMDVTVEKANMTYYAIFAAESSGTFKVTWKQTNDDASMSANLTAY